MNEKLVVYGHSTCPMVVPLKIALWMGRVPFSYVNIHEDRTGRERVLQINDGLESVPTLVFPDGETLTEPGSRELSKRLAHYGYSLPAPSMVVLTIYPVFNILVVMTGMLILFKFLGLM